MIETLKLSCIEEESEEEVEEELDENESNVASESVSKKTMSREEFAERVKEIFMGFVSGGMSPNEAGAKAILQANEESLSMKTSAMEINEPENEKEEEETFNAKDIERGAISLIIKYITKVKDNPSTPKYRMIKLGNKIFDQITSSKYALKYIEFLGFQLFHNEFDFVATIPLSSDITLMKLTAEEFLSTYDDDMQMN